MATAKKKGGGNKRHPGCLARPVTGEVNSVTANRRRPNLYTTRMGRWDEGVKGVPHARRPPDHID